MYVCIGILGRSADNIYIYIDVVFTYYSKEDTTPTPSVASPATTGDLKIRRQVWIEENIKV